MALDVTTTTTDKTHPLDAGDTTTEYKATRFVAWLTGILAVLSTIASFAEKLLPYLPAETTTVGAWLAVAFAAIGAGKIIVYEIQRVALKITAIKYGASVPPAPVSADDAAGRLGA